MVIMHLETPIVVIVPVVVFTLASLYYIIFGLVQASKLKKYLESLPVVKPDANTDNLEPISNSSTQQGSFCRSCGNQLNPGASFCPKCGTKV